MNRISLLKRLDATLGRIAMYVIPRPHSLLCDKYLKILFVRPGGIGDAVLLVPAVSRLRKVFPDARIEILAERRNAGVFAFCPCIDRVLCYDRLRELVEVLRGDYDVIIDSEQSHRLSALVARTLRSRVKIGFGTNERRRMFTHPVAYSHDCYELNSFFELLTPFRVEPSAATVDPFLAVPDADQKSADSMLGSLRNKPFVVLFPGASISERCWGVEKFRQLANCFIDMDLLVVVVGGKEDSASGSAIVKGTCGLNLAGKTSLPETAGILSRARLLVSGDSGVLHMGVGLEIPTVSLFGPGIAEKWAPRGMKHAVINHNLPCSPCTKFGTTPPCPIGARCIQGISVDEVFVTAWDLLSLKQKKDGF
jgi:ADP-heptose:LPS heptosyltransferase